MNELIKITTNEKGDKLVSARELHQFLKVEKKFADWIKNQLNLVDAEINKDYFPLKGKTPNIKGGRPKEEYILNVEIVKEICMIAGVSPNSNSETKILSKQARKYFINCEKLAKQLIEENHKLLLEAKEKTILRLESENRKVSTILQADRYIKSEMYGDETYITSIVINILKKCATKDNILRSTGETYLLNEMPVKEEYIKYKMKDKEFERYIQYFGGCKVKAKCSPVGGGYDIKVGCYSVPSFIIDWDIRECLKQID